MKKKIDLVIPDESLSTIDCWESIATIVFDYLNKDLSTFYTAADFYYDNMASINQELTLDDIFQKTIVLNNKEFIEEYLWYYEHFHSLKLEVVDKKSIAEMKKVIEEELYNNNPIIVFVDSYYCKFNKMYLKYHIPHAFLTSGINKDKLIITDPTQHIEPLEVEIDDIYLCTEKLVKIRDLSNNKTWEPIPMIKYNFIRTNFRSTDSQNARLKNIESFFEDIMKSKSQIFRSFDNSEESLSILFTWRLKNMALHIKKFTVLIEKTYTRDVLHLLPMLKDSYNSWLLAGRSFMKMYYANERQREEMFRKFCNILNNIITLERAILKEFESLLKLEEEA
ncbi:hypothetical protein P4604_14915 [Lysinibacillus capsici]|uniref:hypothetical protein n=1 Tax=Lysinibacillus capsici TaxID=2115968 RepID=UPI002E1C3A5A|nr:hypothetical protein [Lysinibacillus capsici]